jgi:GT2 family glycosyltransferase
VSVSPSNLTICFATIDRPGSCFRLVESIRKFYPTVRILIGEQARNRSSSKLTGIDAEVVHLPYDFGVSASRNALVTRVKTPYFLLCDDDFIFTKVTDIACAQIILDSDPNIAVVGGLLFDIYDGEQIGENNPRSWEKVLHLDQNRKTVTLFPAGIERSSPRYAGDTPYFLVDAVLNFAMMRTSAFHKRRLGWDPQFKITGEHEDFYLNLKTSAPDLKVAYCPSMMAYHHHAHSHYGDDYQRLRSRLEGWRLFSTKWNVDRVIDVKGAWGGFIHAVAAEVTEISSSYSDQMQAIWKTEGRFDLPRGAIGIDFNGRVYTHMAGPESCNDALLVNGTTGDLLLASKIADNSPPVKPAEVAEPIAAPCAATQLGRNEDLTRYRRLISVLSFTRHPFNLSKRIEFRRRWHLVQLLS